MENCCWDVVVGDEGLVIEVGDGGGGALYTIDEIWRSVRGLYLLCTTGLFNP